MNFQTQSLLLPKLARGLPSVKRTCLRHDSRDQCQVFHCRTTQKIKLPHSSNCVPNGGGVIIDLQRVVSGGNRPIGQAIDRRLYARQICHRVGPVNADCDKERFLRHTPSLVGDNYFKCYFSPSFNLSPTQRIVKYVNFRLGGFPLRRMRIRDPELNLV